MDPYETKIADVLSSSAFLSRHPAGTQLGSDIYSNSENAVSELMNRQRYTGQYISTTNQLSFNGQSTFFLQPGSVLNQCVISAEISVPQHTRAPDLWLLHAIQSIELQLSGSSSIQSLKISGRSHFDMIKATLDSKKLELLNKSCRFLNVTSPSGATVKASVPLHLFFSSAEMRAVFPLDSSTLQSQVLVNIRWKNNYEFLSGDSVNAVSLPTSFDDLYLRVMDQVVISNDFALANSLKMDPELVYSIPGTYIQTYSQIVNVASLATEYQVNLTSMPSGMLQCILVSCSALSQEGSVSTQTLIQPWSNFETVRVLYNGIELVRYDSYEELMLGNACATDKDNGINYEWRGHYQASAATSPVIFNNTGTVILPFCNEVSQVLRGRRHEHTKDYSGSSIQFFFRIASGVRYAENNTIATSDTIAPNPTGDYRLNFTFVNNGLYEVSQRSVSLEM